MSSLSIKHLKNTLLSFSLLSKLLTPYILKSDGLKGRFLFVAKSLYYTGWDLVRAMVERNIEKCSTCFIMTDNNFIKQTKVVLIEYRIWLTMKNFDIIHHQFFSVWKLLINLVNSNSNWLLIDSDLTAILINSNGQVKSSHNKMSNVLMIMIAQKALIEYTNPFRSRLVFSSVDMDWYWAQRSQKKHK